MSSTQVTVPDTGDDADDDAPARMGRFELVGPLGTGGMGIVFEARDTLLDRRVALKLLKPGVDREPALLHEARALARLAHPNVVTVFDVGTHGDDLFIAMELVEGETLAAWMSAPHRWQEIIDVFVPAGHGLAAIHELGLVHRDFKPSNVLLDRAGTPKVGDFGIVCAADEVPDGEIRGTPAYMAPEQRLGKAVDSRADQYAFATALDEALRARGPARLRPILARARAEDPTLRYPSMRALLVDLVRARRGPRRWWLAAGGAAVVAGVTFAAWTFGRGASTPDPCPTPASPWTEARGAELRAHVTGIDPVQGASRFAVVDRVAGEVARSWQSSQVEVCRATRVAGTQSDTLLDLRMTCLDQRRAELDAALAAIAAAPGKEPLDASVAALAQVTSVSSCLSLDADDARDVPADPSIRGAVDALTVRLDAIEVEQRASKLKGLPERAAAALAEARTLGHAGTLATALAAHARVAMRIGDFPAALAALRELVQVAAGIHDDRDEAFAWTTQIGILGYELGQHDDALEMVPAATAAVRRAGDNLMLRVNLLYAQAQVLGDTARAPEAQALLEEAERVLIEAGAAGQPTPLMERLADVRLELGSTHMGAGDHDGSIAKYEEAIALYRILIGPDSVDEAIARHNVGEALRRAGRRDEALASLREAARINEARGGETPLLASNLVSIGAVLGSQGAWPEALDATERALAISDRVLAPDDLERVPVMVQRADALGHAPGREDDAFAQYVEVMALIDRTHATTFNLPIALSNRGDLYARLRRCEDALADYTRAEVEMIAQRGPDTPRLIRPLVGRGRCLVKLERAREAIAPLERAAALGAEGSLGRQQRAWLGRALVDSRRDRAVGLKLALAARAELAVAASTDPDAAIDLAELDAWLARQR